MYGGDGQNWDYSLWNFVDDHLCHVVESVVWVKRKKKYRRDASIVAFMDLDLFLGEGLFILFRIFFVVRLLEMLHQF